MNFQLTNPCCEYQTNPLGIEARLPRLSWEMQSDRRGTKQSAYQILTAASPDKLNETDAVWNSGCVESDATAFIEYTQPLASRQRVYWTARAWDESGATSDWLVPQWFEVGIQTADWTAEWIGAPLAGGAKIPAPAPFLRRVFVLNKPVKSARLYATALGLYECEINGQRVGDLHFTPGWTDYRKRVQFQTYDVSALLQQGDNAWGAVLGDGWYCGHIGWRDRQYYGDRPHFRAQLEVEFEDGTRETVSTDKNWTYAFGPILENDLLMGESYDARRELKGWSSVVVDRTAVWQSVVVSQQANLEISAPLGPPVRATEELKALSVRKHGDGWIFDMGQNMVGRVRLSVSGKAGKTLRLRFAEVLEGGPTATEGGLYLANLRAARCTDYYTLRGDGEETWEPRFTFHGFRYVEVTGIEGTLDESAITGIVYHSDTPKTGDFSCSEPLLNQLQKNIDWGQRGNFLDIPTDCPQRDERLGWTGDAQVFIRTATWNRDVAGFFTEWARDVRDAQTAEGSIPSVAPNVDLAKDGGAAWSDAAIICPWTIYKSYGDVRILRDNYDVFTKFFEQQEATARDNIRPFNTRDGFGDWLAMDNGFGNEGRTPKDLLATAFFAHAADLLSRIAGILDKPEDAAHYAKRFQEIRETWHQRWVTPQGLVASQTQTGYLLALHFDLVPDELRPRLAQELVNDIQKNGNKLTAGFAGSSYLAPVLAKSGHLDTAYALLHQTQWPSWLYAVTQGATTIWERWDGWTKERGFQNHWMNSFNHYAYGAIGEWLYSTVAGIDFDEAHPGYKHIILRPQPGGILTSASAYLHSMHGRIASSWTQDGSTFEWHVEIPTNASATVFIPCDENAMLQESGAPLEDVEGIRFVRRDSGASVYEAGSGSYAFRVS
jgi:alpha-L-rhamnosidase